jgi:hypothetical protein
VGSADWSSAGGKEEGERLAWQIAVQKIAQAEATQTVTVFEIVSTEKTVTGKFSSGSGHFQSLMAAETPTTGVKVRTVAKAYRDYSVYVLVERVN